MTSNTPQFASQGGAQLTQQFRYDQLNRLTASNALAAVGQSTDMFKTTYAYDAGGNITNLKRFNKFGVQYDNMQYVYHNTDNNYASNTNKLRSVDDDVAFTTRDSTDIDDQNVDNYQYDDIGNLIQDKQEHIANIEWTVYGKIKSVTRTTGSTKADLEFAYDASGNRVSKLVKHRDVNGLRPSNEWTTTYYVREASGNVMSLYEQTGSTIKLSEQYVYGSSCVGIVKPTFASDSGVHVTGQKELEITDHLGTVRVIRNDRNITTAALDVLPFGSVLRAYNLQDLTFSYNGKRLENELSGTGNAYDFDARIQDPRLGGRFLSIDPKASEYSFESPYVFAVNNPIKFIDKDGKFKVDPEFAEKFPMVTLIILNADLLYNNKPLPPDVQKALEGVDVQAIFNDVFRAAFEEFSTLSPEKIQEIICPGSGPLIKFKHDFIRGLKDGEIDTRGDGFKDINGKNVVKTYFNGTETVETNENITEEGELLLNDQMVGKLEAQIGGAVDLYHGGGQVSHTIKNKTNTFVAVISTLFHESVHYGRNYTGVGNKGVEKGAEWEIKVFKKNIDPPAAENLDIYKHNDNPKATEGTYIK
jgi:RHS repeat-associated protein